MSYPNVTIDGITYVPEATTVSTAQDNPTPMPANLDCDGHPLAVGNYVKIRQSKLSSYSDRFSNSLRHGIVRGFDGAMTLVEFDHEFKDGHNGASLTFSAKMGHGWYVETSDLRFISAKAPFAESFVEESPAEYTGFQDCDGKPIYIGDRVKIRQSALGKDDLLDGYFTEDQRSGTVRNVGEYGGIGVEFDHNFGGHSLNGDCQDGFGWLVKAKRLRHLPSEMVAEEPVQTYADCDGNPIKFGDTVKVRLSALNNNTNRAVDFTASERTGIFRGPSYDGMMYAVEFPFDRVGFHSCNGKVQSHRGRYLRPQDTRLVSSS